MGEGPRGRRGSGLRHGRCRRQKELCPYGLAGCRRAWCDAPVVRERFYEEQAAAGLGAWGRCARGRESLRAGVRDLDAEHAVGFREREAQVEVAAGDVAVLDGVRGELGGDQGHGLVGG